MRFKTHQEVDDHYAKQGLDIPKLKREEQAVGVAMQKSHSDAKRFLKRRMGFTYYLWLLLMIPFGGAYLSRGFGHDGYEDKAMELGWKSTFQYPVMYLTGKKTK